MLNHPNRISPTTTVYHTSSLPQLGTLTTSEERIPPKTPTIFSSHPGINTLSEQTLVELEKL